MIACRDATPADGPELNAMARQSFVDTFTAEYDPADFATYLDQAYGGDGLVADLARPDIAFRIARADDRIVGYAKVSALTLPHSAAAPGAFELRQLYVATGWHGTGVAAMLMDWTLAHARAAGAPELYLAVFEFNHRARAFYRRHGFEEVGEYDFRVGSRVDRDRLMRLAL